MTISGKILHELPAATTLAAGALFYTTIGTGEGDSRKITLADLETQIAADLALADYSTDITALQVAVAALQGDVSLLQGQMVTVQTDIGLLQGQMVTVQTDIGLLQGQMVTVQTDIGLLQGDLSVVQGAYVAGRGQGAINRIAFWTDADTLNSDANLLWDGTAVTIQGNLSVCRDPLRIADSVVIGPMTGAWTVGSNSVAIGYDSSAEEAGATAVGANTTALLGGCVAIGRRATADTLAGSVAIGQDAYANGGIAIGYQIAASGTRSVFIGDNGSAEGPDSIGLGSDTYIPAVGDGAVAIGADSGALQVGAIAIGDLAGAALVGSIAIGKNANGAGTGAVSIGHDSDAVQAQNIAIGQAAWINGGSGIAIGYRAGRPNGTTRTGTGVLIGVNADPGAAANVVGIGANVVSNGSGSTAVGSSAQATSDWTVALGRAAQATGAGAIAIGGVQITASKTAGIGQTNSDSGYTYNATRYITDFFVGGGSTSTTCEAVTWRGSNASGTNIAGADVIIHGGRGTGTAVGGSTRLRVAAPGASGSSLNAATDALVVSWDATQARNRVSAVGTLGSTNQESFTRISGGTNTASMTATDTGAVLIGGSHAYSHAANLYNWIGIGPSQTVNAPSAINFPYDGVLIGGGITIDGNASDVCGVFVGHYIYSNGYNNVGIGPYVEFGTPVSQVTSSVAIGYAASIAGSAGGNIVIGTYASASHSGAIVLGNDGYSSAVDEFSLHDIAAIMVRNLGTSFLISLNGTGILTLNSSQQVLASSLGTAALPTYSFLGDPNTGIYSESADRITFATNGARRFYISNTLIEVTGGTTFQASGGLEVYRSISSDNNGAARTFGQLTGGASTNECASIHNEPSIQAITGDKTGTVGLAGNRTRITTSANLTTARIVTGVAGWYDKANLGAALGVGGALTLTNYYGGYLADIPALAAGVTVTNQYGIYIEEPTRGSTRNRPLHIVGGESFFGGDLLIGTTGKGLKIAEGSNATMGVATLVAGTITVSTTKVTANSRIFISANSNGSGPHALHVSARTAGVSFTITSSNGSDTSDIAWMIVEPA